MAEKSTFIKLDRNIQNWRWYTDANTFRVFVHLLLNANVTEKGFMLDTITRGSLATSIGHIAGSVGITYEQCRTALKHLQLTNEITIKKRPKYIVISILNYNKYQDKPTQNPNKTQTEPTQSPRKPQQSKNGRSKEVKNPPYGGTMAPPSVWDVSTFVLENGLQVDAQRFVDYYESVGWMVGKQPMKDWRAVCRRWSGTEDYSKAQKHELTIDEKLERAALISERMAQALNDA